MTAQLRAYLEKFAEELEANPHGLHLSPRIAQRIREILNTP